MANTPKKAKDAGHGAPDLDEATLQIAKRLLNTPPKRHSEMKIGRRKAKAGVKSSPKPKEQTEKPAK